MKTRHITLAILSAASAGAFTTAHADDTSGVTLSGYIRAGYEGLNGNANQAWGSGANTSSSAVAGRSEINFSGKEDLGNGLSGIFQVSNRFSPTGSGKYDAGGGSSGTFATNDSFVGLKSATWGAVRIGTNYSNFEDGKYDNTVALGPDNLEGLFGDTQAHNMVRYDLPSFGAFNASLQYATEENATASNKSTQHVSIDANYDVGNWGVSAAFSSSPNTVGAVSSSTTSGVFTAFSTWTTNASTSVGTLNQAHFTAQIKPLESLQFAVEYQRDTFAGNTDNKTALYAYLTQGALQYGLQGGYISYSGNTVAGLTNGKFIDAFVHYSLSKQTMVYLEALDDKGGALSVASGDYNSSRTVAIVGLSKSF
jgi:predicted porin